MAMSRNKNYTVNFDSNFFFLSLFLSLSIIVEGIATNLHPITIIATADKEKE